MSLFLRYLTAERFPQGHLLFDHGDIGRKFYVVMKGQVNIFIPLPSELELDLPPKPSLKDLKVEIAFQSIKHLHKISWKVMN